MWAMLCSGLIMNSPISISCCSFPAKLSNPVTKKPMIPTSRYTAPNARARISGTVLPRPVTLLPADAAMVCLLVSVPPPSCRRVGHPIPVRPDRYSPFAQSGSAQPIRVGSAGGGARPPDDEGADRQQVDRRRPEALEGVPRVVDHRPARRVQAGVDHDRQPGAPLEALQHPGDQRLVGPVDGLDPRRAVDMGDGGGAGAAPGGGGGGEEHGGGGGG